MSAENATEFVDDRELTGDSEHDPHGVVPESFTDDWNADTIPEALANAEAAPSSTPTYDRCRCPECGNVQVAPKSVKWDTDQREPGAYKCLSCGAHFPDPEWPETQQQTFRDVKRDAAATDRDRSDDRRGIDLIDPETCAEWRRRIRGAPNWQAEFKGDVWKPTGRHHVRGRCDCDHDVPPMDYYRSPRGGEWGVAEDA